MDKLINKFRWREGIWGVVTVTGLASVALLFVSGQGRHGAPRNFARAGDVRANAAAIVDHPFAIGAARAQVHSAAQGNTIAGERRYLQACSACHGAGGLGQPHMGANLRDSRFIREQSDDALVAFVKTGRPLGDPKSVLGLSMPPLAGNPTLDEPQIRDIVAFLRTVQSRAAAQGAQAESN